MQLMIEDWSLINVSVFAESNYVALDARAY